MYKNKWTCLAWNAAFILAGNLLTRPFIAPDKPLFSWNIPICVAIVLIMWPISWHFNKKMRKRAERLDAIGVEIDQIVEELRAANRRRYEAKARLIDDFLNRPETGVKRDIPKRRLPNDHNPEPRDFFDKNGGL